MNNNLQDLTAIQIGISSDHWDYATPEDSFDTALSEMQKKRYDLYPIIDSGHFTTFYVTSVWNRISPETVTIKTASGLPKLHAETSFLGLLDYFDEADHKFALLEREGEIVGLISSVNFSWPEIYFRLYNVLASFEMKLADWLFQKKAEGEVLSLLLSGSDNSSNKNITVGQYLIDERKGEENHLQGYLFLSSLINIIGTTKLYEHLGFQSRREFDQHTKYLSDIRNNIAHPVRRMIKRPEDFKRLKISLAAIQFISTYI